MFRITGRARLTAVTAAALLLTGSITAWATGAIPDSGETAEYPQLAQGASQTQAEGSTAGNARGASDILAGITDTVSVVIDPAAGGSADVVYPDPSEFEQPVPGNPAAPTNLRITQLGDTTVTASFDAPAGVSTLSAYIRYGDSFTQQGLGATRTVTFTGLTAGWDYVLCVYYSVGSVESNKACADVHTTGTRATEPEPLDAPTGLVLDATTSTLTATWNPVASATSYRVCHVSGDMSWQCGGYRQLTDTSVVFDDGSIDPATQYGVTVVAVGADGVRSDESRRFITTPGNPPPAPTKYAAPTNIRVTAITPTTVTIAWDYPDDAPITVWSFTIRQQTSYTSVGVAGSARSFTFTGLAPGLGHELILEGRDAASKYTEAGRLGFFAPAS